jgi:hypothetical protein
MVTQTATLDQFTFDYLTNLQVACIASWLNASETGVTTERVTFDCGATPEPNPGMVHLACQYLYSRRADRVLAGLRAADWGPRRRDHTLTLGDLLSEAQSPTLTLARVWSDRHRLADDLSRVARGWDHERDEMILLMGPDLFIALGFDTFGTPSTSVTPSFVDWLATGNHAIRIVGLMGAKYDATTGKYGYILGDSEAYLLRLDRYPQDPCRSTVQLHVKEEPTITATEEDGRKRWALVADEAVVIDPSCGYRFGCAPKA